MQIRRGIVELVEAIPERIEVSGRGPTWEVTGGSFDSVVSYANDAFGDPVVVARRDRSRWWPRVTLTVTTDPDLAAAAPPLEGLTDPCPTEPVPDPCPTEPVQPAADVQHTPRHRADEDIFESALEEIFAHQEAVRLARDSVPRQRRRG